MPLEKSSHSFLKSLTLNNGGSKKSARIHLKHARTSLCNALPREEAVSAAKAQLTMNSLVSRIYLHCVKSIGYASGYIAQPCTLMPRRM